MSLIFLLALINVSLVSTWLFSSFCFFQHFQPGDFLVTSSRLAFLQQHFSLRYAVCILIFTTERQTDLQLCASAVNENECSRNVSCTKPTEASLRSIKPWGRDGQISWRGHYLTPVAWQLAGSWGASARRRKLCFGVQIRDDAAKEAKTSAACDNSGFFK